MEATLSGRPPNSKATRFKASLQGASSGSTVLPSGQPQRLTKAVRTGKLMPDGKLSGGVEGDSDTEDTKETQTQRALDMLMRGEVISRPSFKSRSNSQPDNGAPSEPPPRSTSKFSSRRQFANDVSNSSLQTAAQSPVPSSANIQSSPFRKPPTVISMPKTASTTTLAAVS